MANRIEAWGKRMLRAPLLLFPKGPPPPLPPPSGSIRRVVLLRPDERIGNLILLTPMLDAIHRAWPGVEVDLVAGGAVAGLAVGDPRIRDVIVFDKRALVQNPFGIVAIARRLGRGRYDLAVDASHSHQFSLTAACLTGASGARYRLGYLRDDGNRVLNVGLRREAGVRRHTAELYLDLLRVMAPGATGGDLTFPVRDDEMEASRRALAAAGVLDGSLLIGIHPGGRGTKRWPVERFVELTERLAAIPGCQIALFTGPGEDDLAAFFPADRVCRVARLPLRTLAAAFRSCRLFVSGDTGPMHMAAAVGTPTLALFIHGNADMFAPRGDRHRHVTDALGPSVDRVHREVLEMLDLRAPGSAADSRR